MVVGKSSSQNPFVPSEFRFFNVGTCSLCGNDYFSTILGAKMSNSVVKTFFKILLRSVYFFFFFLVYARSGFQKFLEGIASHTPLACRVSYSPASDLPLLAMVVLQGFFISKVGSDLPTNFGS